MNEATELIDLHAAGFRMPPEWHPHAATWLAWPHNRETWPENLSLAQEEFWQLVVAISQDEPVCIVADLSQRERGAELRRRIAGQASENIRLFDIPTNDAWLRDYGPTFCTDPSGKRLAAVDWKYNAWGGKYPPFDADQQIVTRLLDHAQGPTDCLHARSRLCLEGGAIEIDESGLLLCTTRCALNPNRNPGLDQASVTAQLQQSLGASAVIWLRGDSLIGDDTDGHIDQLARFTPAGSILYAWVEATDPQHGGLAGNLDDLQQSLRLAKIQKELVPLPLPEPVLFDGVRLPASYCNFYITNRSVLVPQFDVPQDGAALQIIGQHFPDHQVVGLPSRNLLVGLGSFHCLTQQQPRL
ncbi:MAG: agmatine deiminase family protein [Mariniblastus sp.]|nr:agmatine deiminase family protein [Mariniblastus sp.]